MSNNRTEQQALVDNLAPTVELAELQLALTQAGYVFKKDVVSSQNVSGGSGVINFTDNDQIKVIITDTNDTNLTITGLQDGQIARLQVNKINDLIVDFVGVDWVNDAAQEGYNLCNYLLINIDNQISVYRISNNQLDGTIPYTSMSYGSGTVDSDSFLDYYVDGRIAYFNGLLKVDKPGGDSSFIVDVNKALFVNFIEENKSFAAAVSTLGYDRSHGVVLDNGSVYRFIIYCDTESGTVTVSSRVSFSVPLK